MDRFEYGSNEPHALHATWGTTLMDSCALSVTDAGGDTFVLPALAPDGDQRVSRRPGDRGAMMLVLRCTGLEGRSGSRGAG
jgi:hypothetical protein